MKVTVIAKIKILMVNNLRKMIRQSYIRKNKTLSVKDNAVKRRPKTILKWHRNKKT